MILQVLQVWTTRGFRLYQKETFKFMKIGESHKKNKNLLLYNESVCTSASSYMYVNDVYVLSSQVTISRMCTVWTWQGWAQYLQMLQSWPLTLQSTPATESGDMEPSGSLLNTFFFRKKKQSLWLNRTAAGSDFKGGFKMTCT